MPPRVAVEQIRPSSASESDEGQRDYQILLVEDDASVARSLEILLGPRYTVRVAGTGKDAIDLVRDCDVDLMLLDIRLPDIDGLTVLRTVRQIAPLIDVIMLTAVREVRSAVTAMKLGAREYIQKPFERDELLLYIKQAHEKRQLEWKVAKLRSELYGPFRFRNIVTGAPRMEEAIEMARRMANADVNVLVTGESGTGKELLARAIHFEGSRRNGPFVALNCARYAGPLLDSELFGHERGAFTGADRARRGRFEMADGGTLFLDEVGTTADETQAKLLRVIEQQCFERVGSEQTTHVDVRILAATNMDLEAGVNGGRFREDLFYRLNAARIELPPLRERREDVPLLVEHFLEQQLVRSGKAFHGVTKDAMGLLMLYDWKGNVRELENLIRTSAALEDGEWITARYFTPPVLAAGAQQAGEPANRLTTMVDQFERSLLVAELRANNWNRRAVARSLGVHRNTIESKMKKHDVVPD